MKLSETRDILAYIEHLHEQIRQAYKALAGRFSDPRAKLLLDYLEQFEAKWAAALHEFTHQSQATALREWEPAELDDRPVLDRLGALQHDDVRVEDLVDATLDISAWFEAFYAELERMSQLPEQSELFASLRSHAEREKKRLAHNVNMLGDF